MPRGVRNGEKTVEIQERVLSREGVEQCVVERERHSGTIGADRAIKKLANSHERLREIAEHALNRQENEHKKARKCWICTMKAEHPEQLIDPYMSCPTLIGIQLLRVELNGTQTKDGG